MPAPVRYRRFLLAATSASALLSAAAHGQDASSPLPQAEDEVEEVVVTAGRERGAVLGNVTPELQLNAGDVRSLGVSSIQELLTELGPQLQSSSGRPPVTLLEGHRIASFREIASIPAEAIARVDILPEEVGLRYGYGADQRVMNIVLRQRFRAFTGEVTGRMPTAGAGETLELEGGFLGIRNGQRVNLSGDYEGTGRIMETDRDLARPESPVRTLRPEQEQLTLNGSYSRPLGERTNATLSAEITTSRSESNVGLAVPAVTIPGGTPFADGSEDKVFYPLAGGLGALERSSSSQTGQIGMTIAAQRSTGQWTLTANYIRAETRGISSRPYNLADYAQAIALGEATADPALPIAAAYLVARPADLTETRTDTANLDIIYNRALFDLPAGEVSATARVGASTLQLESDQEIDRLVSSRRLGRDSGSGSVNLDIPIFSASDAIGRLSANASGGFEHLSDAGTLRQFALGLNWTPRRGIALSASYRDDQTAATPQQLGDPQTVTQFVPVFDYVRGESVLVTTISGGNPALDDARTRNWRLGLMLNPLQEPNLMLTIEYNHRSTSGGITNFPGVTADTALAFPDRFLRNSDGRLIQLDLRPINLAEQTRESIRWGLNFSMRLPTPQSQIDAMRAAFERRAASRSAGQPGAGGSPQAGSPQAGSGQAASASPAIQPGGQTAPPAPGPPPAGASVPGGPGGPAPGGFGVPRGPGGGRFGGGPGGGGRINFAVYHEWMLGSTTQIAPSLPVLDLLGGDSLGDGAGPSRHKIEVQAGLFQSGYGLRLSGNWKSATRIDGVAGVPSSRLHFGDLATVDLRLFANIGQMPGLVEKVPLLRGVRIQLGIDNLFDARQRVTDGNGDVPFAYQGAFIDPVGRSVRLSIRKLIF